MTFFSRVCPGVPECAPSVPRGTVKGSVMGVPRAPLLRRGTGTHTMTALEVSKTRVKCAPILSNRNAS